MKVKNYLLVGTLAFLSILVGGCGQKEVQEAAAVKDWKPNKNIEWLVTSGAGGGSDIYTRQIIDIIKAKGMVNQTFIINNQTDGGGEVGRLKVSQAKDDGHLLLTFNSGDLMPMVKNTSNRIKNFKPIAILATDIQILLRGNKTPYSSLQEALDAAANGKSVLIGGSKGADTLLYDNLLEKSNLDSTQLQYMMFDSTSEAITSLLGGHIDYCISKPATSLQYMESGDAEAVVVFKKERAEGKLADVPTLSEATGLENIDSTVWRGVVASASMPDEAVKYWSNVLKQVSQSKEWKSQYIEKNGLTACYMDNSEATKFMGDYQNDYLKKIGK